MHLRKMAIVAVAIFAAFALWLVGLVCTPWPGLFGALFGLSLLLGIWLAFLGLIGVLRGRGTWVVGLLGLGVVASAGLFAYGVLAHDEGPLPIVHGADGVYKTDRIRVIDFNVLHGYPDFEDQETRFQDTLAAMRALNPDLLVLQEVWSTHAHGKMAERLGRKLKMNHVYARANGSLNRIGFEEGSAILSRFPIVEARSIVLTPRRPVYENRIAVIAKIDVNGEIVTIVGAHLSYFDEATSAAQARSLLSRLPSDHLLFLAGDFNARSDSPAVGLVRDAQFRDSLPGDIDHLFVPLSNKTKWQLDSVHWTFRPDDLPGLIGKNTEISDHSAIVADFVRR